MIDHVGLGVSNLEQSKAFYQQALAPLGYQLLIERDGSLGFGHNSKPDFFIHINRPLSGPTHVAIASPDRATVHAFHAAGLAPEVATTALPAYAPTTTSTTTAPSSWTRKATTSRPSATGRRSSGPLHSLTHVNPGPKTRHSLDRPGYGLAMRRGGLGHGGAAILRHGLEPEPGLVACSGGHSRSHSTRPNCTQPDRTQRKCLPNLTCPDLLDRV